MLWLQGGLLVATLILGIKTGLILGTSWLNRWWLIMISGIFGISLYGLVLAFSAHQQVLVMFLDRYTFVGSLLMAVLLIYLGLQQGPEQGCSSFRQPVEKALKLGFSLGHWKFILGFLPCPLCLAALSFSIILISPMVGMSLSELGRVIALLFLALVLVTSVAIRKIVQLVKFNPATIFNTLLLFIGILTLTFALTVPNFVQSMAMPLAPLTISSPHLVALVLVVMAGLGLWGYILYQISYVKDCDNQ
ncbi:DUF2162 domain-containing protein [Desulfoscipio gibsoniae]|uniref:Putative transporter n=1 Tax=Desulfoscipio gibsoniae DSM 7213 TaxID=767817 RepID=R4KL51_9FIRM|nr:DUF2162 domain-containing protein [Desulfoscipio gibsoniae]AGL00366.1 putative transporter [Desulfoscipio gibsoniae DSM 7213]